jgi:heme/copper-type cytochrome/quinol oxidase subunit 2
MPVNLKPIALLIACSVLLLRAPTARAQDAAPEITLTNGRWVPSELAVPANASIKIHVTNADTIAVEFESFELHRERVVQPGETITVYLPALAPGTYKFFDDFHRDTPEGTIVAK